jgi:ribosomal protein S18 acetylase RimI-like enzyme
MQERASYDSHIRAIRLKQDLPAVADLIELCFAENMDADGRDYLRHIRQTANNFSAFLLDTTTPETSSLPFHGYIWEEKDCIIGNLTLIPVRKKVKGTYFIANVAVHPDHRGKGIAQQLTQRALKHVQEHNGKQVFLQVRQENDPAVHIYLSHGFEEISRRTTWVFRPKQSHQKINKQDVKITRRYKEDWEQQKLWLEINYPSEIAWNLPFKLERFNPSFSNWFYRFLKGEHQRTWASRKQGKLIGTVTLERCSESYDYLWIGSSLSWENEVIESLLPVIQRNILFPYRLAVNFPVDRGRESFIKVGMEEINTLIWMQYTLPTSTVE